jgi:hypothetical protein
LIAVALVAPWRGGGGGVLDRALAAIGNGRVVHSVIRTSIGSSLVEINTGRSTPELVEEESWYDAGAGRLHMIVRYHGRIADELLVDRSTPGVRFSQDPAFKAFPGGYRDALASGAAHVAGKATYHGRPIYWVRFGSRHPSFPWSEVAIDRRTFKPLAIRVHVDRIRTIDEQILLAETKAYRASDFARRSPKASSSTTSSSSGTSVNPVPATPTAVLSSRWLWMGNAFRGLKLASSSRFTSEKPRHGTGVELVYGRGQGDPRARYLAVRESTVADTGPAPPHGFMRVAVGTTGNGQSTGPIWTGELRRGRLSLELETTLGERAVLEAARALRKYP